MNVHTNNSRKRLSIKFFNSTIIKDIIAVERKNWNVDFKVLSFESFCLK